MSAIPDMGGYGAFVWPAYGLVMVVLVGLAAVSWRQLHMRTRALAELERRRHKEGER
ncbi:MAG: heme exporter protein CcmD [Rhodothalassiaceae bacterium]